MNLSANSLFEQAIQAHQKGDVIQAQKLYEAALAADPQNAVAHNNLANLYYKQNNLILARQHYIKAIHLEPGYVAAHVNLGLVLLQQNELEAANKQFNNVVALQPDLPIGHQQLANLCLRNNELESALEHYQTVLKLQPEHTEALNNSGVIYLKQNKFSEAENYFTKALLFDPKHKDARNNLAGLLLQQDRFADALWNYQLYLQLAPEDSYARYNMGVALMATGQLEEAIKQFEQTVQLNPNYIDALCNLGAIYLKLDDRKQAIENYQRALSLQPNNEAIQYMLNALTRDAMPATAPAEYIKNLFDNYAGYFDKHLTETLRYKTPQLLRELTHKFLSAHIKILDLGCGTGLSGAAFHDLADKLVGIDLSPRMLAKAKEKNIYDDLFEANILDALQNQTTKYDLVISIDTLVYFGDLTPIFENVKKVLTEKGIFAFSIESSQEKDYLLNITGRYIHNPAYIEKLATQFDFKVFATQSITGREQDGKPAAGYLFVLQK